MTAFGLGDFLPEWRTRVSGLPAITLPLHSSTDGMPIGMMFGAGLGKEATLFRLSGQLERAHPWRTRHPRLSC